MRNSTARARTLAMQTMGGTRLARVPDMSKTIIATYETVPAANRAVSRLFEERFEHQQISMMVSDATREKHLAIEHATKAPEGASAGALIGGTLGAIAAGLTAVAGIVIPGVGLAISGPIAAALAGLGAGGAAGGLLGGLVGLGFTETEAKVVEDAVKNGNVVVSITVDGSDRASVAEGVFKSTSAQSVATA